MPVLIKAGEWAGWRPLTPLLIVGFLGGLVLWTRPLSALRELGVGADVIEIRLLFRRAVIPLNEVMSVTRDDERQHQVNLSDGSTFFVDVGPHGDAIARPAD